MALHSCDVMCANLHTALSSNKGLVTLLGSDAFHQRGSKRMGKNDILRIKMLAVLFKHQIPNGIQYKLRFIVR